MIKKLSLLVLLIFLTACTLPETICIKHQDLKKINDTTDLGTIQINWQPCDFPAPDEIKINLSEINLTEVLKNAS